MTDEQAPEQRELAECLSAIVPHVDAIDAAEPVDAMTRLAEALPFGREAVNRVFDLCKAGLEQGDVIVGVDGRAVADSSELRLTVSQLPPGTEVTVSFIRDGEDRSVDQFVGR